ncbi:hypothetical protein GCM10028819_33350 [Spirosoma humi]
MNDEKIKTGSVVKLKSGGLLMTAGDYFDGANMSCYWFDKNFNLQTQVLPIEALVFVSDEAITD